MILFIRSFIRRLVTDNISFLAGGVAYYGLLALFPAMAALVSLFGVFANPVVVREELEKVQELFPPDVFTLIHDQILILTSQPNAALSLTALVSILITVASASRGTKAMLAALNVVFRLQEGRKWLTRQFLAYFLTLGAILLLILALFVVVALPLAVEFLPPLMKETIAMPLAYVRWLILSAAIWGGLIVLFAIGPNRPVREERLLYIVIGATVATIAWLGGALIASKIVQIIPQFHAAYGSLSAVVLLTFWMLLSTYAILSGAAVTAVLEKADEAESADKRD